MFESCRVVTWQTYSVCSDMTGATTYPCAGKFIFFRRAWKRGSERRGSKGNHAFAQEAQPREPPRVECFGSLRVTLGRFAQHGLRPLGALHVDPALELGPIGDGHCGSRQIAMHRRTVLEGDRSP